MNHEWIERELDHIIMMCADVEVNPNPNEVANTMWVSHEEMEAMLLEERPAEQAISPWFRCIAALVMNESWWTHYNRPDKQALAHTLGKVTLSAERCWSSISPFVLNKRTLKAR